MTESTAPRTVEQRITDYLVGGGLFNPELANHDAVRDLLIDARDAISETQSARGRLAHEVDQWRAFAQRLTGVDANDCGWLRAEMESQWCKLGGSQDAPIVGRGGK